MSVALNNQIVSISYFDSVVNKKINSIAQSVRKVGIYSGGHLYSVPSSTTTAYLSDLVCEILDSGSTTFEQVNVATGIFAGLRVSTTTVTGISATNSLIILQWTYTGAVGATLQALAIAPANLSSYPNALVVGNSSVSGSTLAFDYTSRSNPNIHDLFLRVEPTESLDSNTMAVRVRGGICNYGTQSFQILDQLTSTLTAPGSGSQIVAVQINTSGVVVLTYGAINLNPVPPPYSGLITLAEITITSGQSTITQANIKDVRGYITVATPPGIYQPLGTYVNAVTGSTYISSTGGLTPTISANTGVTWPINISGTAQNIASIWDYGGSTGSPSAIPITSLRIAYGRNITVGGNTYVQLNNLPFTNQYTYTIVVCGDADLQGGGNYPGGPGGGTDQTTGQQGCYKANGNAAYIWNTDDGPKNLQWYAIGY